MKKEDIKKGEDTWYYSDKVKNHFFHPKNVLLKDPKPGEFDAEGSIGAPVCGDVMKMWMKVDKKTGKIKKLKWRTFGCATAIASTSAFSEMAIGKSMEEVLKITPKDIIGELGGVPNIKVHCSILADGAFKKTVEDYRKKTKTAST